MNQKIIWLLILIIFAGCSNSEINQNQISNQTVVVGDTKPKPQNNKPVILGLSANPSSITSGSKITFTVTVHDPDGDTVKYVWNATKGYLSATQGQLVQWTPAKTDGTIENGLGTITVQVDDNKGGVETASLNIMIYPDGAATTNIPSVSTSASPSVAVKSATPSPISQISGTPIPL